MEIINTKFTTEPTAEELEEIKSSGVTAVLAYLKSNPYINRHIYTYKCGGRFELPSVICTIEDKGFIISRKPRTDGHRGFNYSLVGYEEGHRHIPTRRKHVIEKDYLFIGTLSNDKLRLYFSDDKPETRAIIKAASSLSENIKVVTSGENAIEILIPRVDLNKDFRHDEF